MLPVTHVVCSRGRGTHMAPPVLHVSMQLYMIGMEKLSGNIHPSEEI